MITKEETGIFCGKCGSVMRLVRGKYSFYYRCSHHCGMQCSLRDMARIRNQIQLIAVDGVPEAGTAAGSGKYIGTVGYAEEGYVHIDIRRKDR